jgi:cytochrome b6-f complex iron-sulfur subunit
MKKENIDSQVENKSGRRSFLARMWIVLGIAAVAEVVWLVVSFLKPVKTVSKKGDYGSMIAAGPVSSIANDSVIAFPRGRFYLCRLADGGLMAVSRQCTHLGCTVPWDSEQKRFICPCHSSAYDIRGNVVRSPASRPLDIFKIKIENNHIYVDTREPIKRSAFRENQVVYPNTMESKA